MNFKYSFPIENVIGIILHIQAYDSTILSMIPENANYVIEIDKQITFEQFEHLSEQYGLVEIQ